MLTIRRYQQADHDDVWNLYVMGQHDLTTYIEDETWHGDMRSIEQSYLEDGGEFLVGVYEGRIVATGALQRTTATHAEVRRMRVHPHFQRRGFGRLILAELEAIAQSLGYTTLHLVTSNERRAARNLYLSYGFHETERTLYKGIDCIFFEKSIEARRTE